MEIDDRLNEDAFRCGSETHSVDDHSDMTMMINDTNATEHRALATTVDLAEALNAGIPLAGILQLALKRIGGAIGWLSGFAYLDEPGETRSRLDPIAVWHRLGRGAVSETMGETSGSDLSPLERLAAAAFESGQPCWTGSQREGPHGQSLQALAPNPTLPGAMAFPVRVGSKAAGVLAFLGDRPVEPSPSLLRAMAVLCTQLGHAVERDSAERDRLVRQAELESQQQLLKQSDELIRNQYAQLYTAVNNTNHGLAMFDSAQKIVVCNDIYASIYGLSANDIRAGTRLSDIQAMRSAKGVHLSDAPSSDGLEGPSLSLVASSTIHTLHDDRRIMVTCQPLWDGGWVATHEDVTERIRIQERFTHMAHFDSLTDLANRVLFRASLEGALQRLPLHHHLAILWIDLDRFKFVNDTLGHAVGDDVLKIVAGRLCGCAGSSGTVARLGGDEFAILVAPCGGPADAAALATRIGDMIRFPIERDGQYIVLDSSIGIAMAPADADTGEQILKSADLALYRAKSLGGSTFCFFEPAMEAAVAARHGMEADLRAALAEDGFELNYQPIVNLRSGRVESVEALLRWRHPRRGPVSPEQFIPVAEEAGLMAALGGWVLTKACADAATMPQDITIAVNVSASQVMSQTLTERVRDALEESGLKASRLEIEITESVLLRNTGAALRCLRDLHAMGVKIAMDDFGTGYSSLSYLRRFPFDRIKIDRSFVSGLPHESDALAIVGAICGLATSLGVSTTAEGVETEDQLRAIRELDCTNVQGYLVSRPLPIHALRQFLDRFQTLAIGTRRRRPPLGQVRVHGGGDPANEAAHAAAGASAPSDA